VSETETAAAERSVRVAYRDHVFDLTATYWGQPIWGWLPGIVERDARGRVVPESGAEQLIQSVGDAGFRTPYDCLAAAARALLEALDAADGA
jgi:hypothetical protein